MGHQVHQQVMDPLHLQVLAIVHLDNQEATKDKDLKLRTKIETTVSVELRPPILTMNLQVDRYLLDQAMDPQQILVMDPLHRVLVELLIIRAMELHLSIQLTMDMELPVMMIMSMRTYQPMEGTIEMSKLRVHQRMMKLLAKNHKVTSKHHEACHINISKI